MGNSLILARQRNKGMVDRAKDGEACWVKHFDVYSIPKLEPLAGWRTVFKHFQRPPLRDAGCTGRRVRVGNGSRSNNGSRGKNAGARRMRDEVTKRISHLIGRQVSEALAIDMDLHAEM